MQSRAVGRTEAAPRAGHPLRVEDLPPIDAVLISHNHYDHLDVDTLRRLPRTQTFVALGNAAFVKGATDLDWWESASISPSVKVHCVPAQHFSSRGITDRDANLWCGFVLETPRGAIYFAGDTGWGPHFEMIRERFGAMRLALLPIGAFRPEWFMCAVHISPRDAVRAAEALGAEVSIPMHYYTFDLGDDGQDEPARELREALRDGGPRFEILQPGGVYTSPR
jgi:L-ascorbate metabolism protein UlaG (beta-lactamase superfamily)